jgi:tetratricopeptide (TPR) repeat protein/energy-coupling factor transporter ATP-binding protein EcfA2
MADVRSEVSKAIVHRIESPEFNSYNLPNEYSRFDELVNVEITIPILTPPGYLDGHCKTVIDKCINKLNSLGGGYSASSGGFGGWEDTNTGESPAEPHIKLDVDFSIGRWSFGADELRSIILMIQNELLQQCVKLTFNGVPICEPFNLLGERVNSFPKFEEFGKPDTSYTEKSNIDAYLVSSTNEFIDALGKLVTNVPEIEPKTASQNLAVIRDHIQHKKTSEILLVTGRSGCGKSTQLSLIWNDSTKDLELFLTSGKNISAAYKNQRRWDNLIGLIHCGKPIIVEDVCVNTHSSKFQDHIDAIYELQKSVNSPLIVVTQTNKQLGKLFRVNDIQLEDEISLDLSEENPDSIINSLSKFHEVAIDTEGIKILEDALASHRFTAREISQNLHANSGVVVSSEIISRWENSLKLIENLLVGVEREDVAKIFALHKAINQPNMLMRREIPHSYVVKLLGFSTTDMIEIGLIEDLRAKKYDMKLLKTTAEIWLDVALGNLSELRDSKHFITIREQIPLEEISKYYAEFNTKISNCRETIWNGDETNPLPEEIADSWSQIGYDSFLFTPDHEEKNKLRKHEWSRITKYIHSFLMGVDGVNPWIDARLVHDFSYRALIAAAYAEDVEGMMKLNHLHSKSLRDLGKNEELGWIRKSQMENFDTPGTKLNYAVHLWNTGKLQEAHDICISLLETTDITHTQEKLTRNALGLIYRDLGQIESAKEEFEIAISMASEDLELDQSVKLNDLNLRMYVSEKSDDVPKFISEFIELKKEVNLERNPSLYAICCNKLGQLHLGEYQKHLHANFRTGMYGFDTTFGSKMCALHKNEALSYLEQAYEIRKEISDLPGLNGTMGLMSTLFQIEGELDKAFEMSESIYNFYIDSDDLNGQIVELIRMAKIKIQQKDLVHSTDLTTKAHELATNYGNPNYIQQVKNLIQEVIQLSK